MRIRSFFLLALTLLAMPAIPAAAEGPSPPAAQQSAAEPLGENEPLPFMRSEQNAPPEESSSAGLLLKTIGSMLFIVGLIFVGAWGAKKLGYGPAKAVSSEDAARLSVLTSLSLGNGRTVSAIRFNERTLLIGSTPQSFTVLAEDAGNNVEMRLAPRSVAELLAEDETSFSGHLDNAARRLGTFVKGSEIG